MNKPLIDKSLLDPKALFIVAALAVLAVLKYHGADYQNAFYTQISNPGAFPFDIYLAGAVHKSATIFYDLVAFFRLPMEKDVINFSVYLVLSGVSITFTYKIISRHLGVSDPATALLITLLSCFLVSKFIVASQPSVLENVSSGPTLAAHAFGFAALYYLLEKKFLVASLIITLVLAFTIKAAFILLPAAGLYGLLNKEIKKTHLFFLLIPCVFIFYKAATASVGAFPADELLKITEIAIAREEEEGSFHYQPLSALVLFLATFIVFPFLIKKIESASFRTLCWSFYAVTFAVFAFSYIYAAYGYKVYPYPLLILISAPRSVKFYTFLLCIIGFAFILRSQKLEWYEKITAAFSLVLLKGTPAGLAYSAFVIAAGFGLPRLFKKVSGKDIPAFGPVSRMPMSVLLTGLLAVFVALRTPASYIGPQDIEPVAYRYYGIWSQRIRADEETWKAYQSIKKMPDDFVLIAFHYPNGERKALRVENNFNYYSLKSRFYGDVAYFYFNPTGAREAFMRRDVLRELTRVLRESERIPPAIQDFLAVRNVRIMAPADLDSRFPPKLHRTKIGNFILVNFGGEDQSSWGRTFFAGLPR